MADFTEIIAPLISLDTRLGRAQTAEALTHAGFTISPETLATKATRGGGPPFSIWGRRAVYTWGDALAWAQGRLAVPQPTARRRTAAASSKAA
ncbi:DNA-binding protein [Roseomonas nepalensis]|uniref:DNA-binding protein n=1 Tax=Muricoccus nepalensis TaxID=1854500 RepID=A0A502G839_9PROT|nr:DNA-binding protein [Roseomonas nepalensis]TPG58185.1 DNA-binding protein [Roseomonas nepalensis]